MTATRPLLRSRWLSDLEQWICRKRAARLQLLQWRCRKTSTSSTPSFHQCRELNLELDFCLFLYNSAESDSGDTCSIELEATTFNVLAYDATCCFLMVSVLCLHQNVIRWLKELHLYRLKNNFIYQAGMPCDCKSKVSYINVFQWLWPAKSVLISPESTGRDHTERGLSQRSVCCWRWIRLVMYMRFLFSWELDFHSIFSLNLWLSAEF